MNSSTIFQDKIGIYDNYSQVATLHVRKRQAIYYVIKLSKSFYKVYVVELVFCQVAEALSLQFAESSHSLTHCYFIEYELKKRQTNEKRFLEKEVNERAEAWEIGKINTLRCFLLSGDRESNW